MATYFVDLGICRLEAAGFDEPGPGWARNICNVCGVTMVERALDDPAMHGLSSAAIENKMLAEDYPTILRHFVELHPEVVANLN